MATHKQAMSYLFHSRYIIIFHDSVTVSFFYRRMKEHNMYVRECYSHMSDEDVHQKVSAIKARMPHAGFRMVKESLRAMGHHVQWWRVRDSLQRVDGAGITARMIQLRSIAWQKYPVPALVSRPHWYKSYIDKVLRCINVSMKSKKLFELF